MKRSHLGVVVTAVTMLAAACGGGSSEPAASNDTGPGDHDATPADTGARDTWIDTYERPDPPPRDTGIPDPPPPPGTTGVACTDDSTCDVTGDGINACSNALFSLGTLYPSPVCVGKDCDPGDGTRIMPCDDLRGVCLSNGALGICLPACAFGADDGAAPTGCVGKDACNVLGWGKDSAGKLQGVGYCFGGCTADADCTKGDKCQLESGACVKSPVVYVKTLGTACTSADATAKPPTCECLYATSTKKGYCSTFCEVGDATTACATGYTCSPGLPTTDGTGSALFSKDPAGMAGNCLKTCTTDADCIARDSVCKTTASGQVCDPR